MKVTALSAVLSLVVSPAMAAWKVETFKDRMTDQEVKVASLSAMKSDRGIGATLIVRCMVSDVVGGLYLELKMTASFTRGRLGLRYRVDDGETNDRYMPVSSDGRGLSLFANPTELLDGKKLRLELQPAKGPTLFYQFDLTDTRKVLRTIPCKETKL